MKLLTGIVAKILFSIPFLVFGLFHFMNGKHMVGMIPSWLPGGVLWVYLTGAAMIAAVISWWVGKYARTSALLLALLMIVYVVFVHVPGLGNEAMKQMAMSGMLKDLGLAGGALFLAGKLKD